MRRLFQWLFVVGLTAVAPFIAWQTYNQSPAIPTTIVPLWQQFLPVILLSFGVAVSTFCLLRVPAYLRNWPQELRVSLLALLAFLALVILWLAILLAYYTQAAPTGTAVAPPHILILGSAATLFLLLGTLYWADQLYLQSN